MAYKIIKIDPTLASYEKDIDLRMENYKQKKNELLRGQNIVDFADGYKYFGFHRTKTGWVYREWAPAAEKMYLTGDFNDWDTYLNPMNRLENGVFEIELKGKDALQKAVNGMKIPETLDKLKSFFQRVSKSLEQDAKQIELMRSELNKSKTHIKNFGRALFGREVKEAEYVKRDKGLLSSFRKGYEKLSKSFANMSQKASDLADKLRYEKIKSSVKKDLDFLQGKSDNHSKTAPVIDHSR